MIFKGFVIFTLLILNVFISLSQNDSLKLRECNRLKFLAQEERKSIEIDTSATLKLMHFKTEFTYLLKGEAICGTYTKNNYNYIIRSGQDILKLEKDSKIKSRYIDTLFLINKKIDLLKFGDKNIVLKLADYALLKSEIERTVSDAYYTRAFKDTSLKFTSENLTNFYSNLYLLYSSEVDVAAKNLYKQRLISDYFMLSRLISVKKLSSKTQESISNIFNGTIKNCEDLLPDLKVFISELPKDIDLKIKTTTNFISLLKEKSCTDSKEYEMLVDTLIKFDKTTATIIAKAELLIVKKRYSEAISSLNSAKAMTKDAAQLEDIDFQILEVQFYHLNNYQTAYRLALGISGSNKNKALQIAAKCVANSANSCGSSTFDRKCNYYYAAELAERAGDSGAASRYRASAPSSEEKFNNNNPSTVSLSCWGVTVNVR
jgi:hypothetical protein